ncbi:nucleotidyl transferase AbiEii/AbiGii toxin family protein [Glutamicibacter sp. NPDC127525]|uniref:nucleotidyl transferase AbiEii/AbiGii toxin family protein n=1 Tax=unclassified Glutamicibacter TaxID=2627139 RepID=UPI00362564F8
MTASGKSSIELARERRSRDAKIRNAAKDQGTTAELIRKQVAFNLFFQRVFSQEDSRWTLLGGNALLIRTGYGRFTQDVDLSRDEQWEDLSHVQEELEALLSEGDRLDDFSFTITKAIAHSEPDNYGYGSKTAKINVRVDFGGKPFDTFSIDITSRKHITSAVERIQLKPALDDAALTGLPAIPTVQAENHLADKICALYETHQGAKQRPSTRYRDLADMIRFVKDVPFDAAQLILVLKHEQQRRKIRLPDQLVSPHPSWNKEYPKAARAFAQYPQHLLPLDKALDYAGTCLNEILNNTRTEGRWNPEHQQWEPANH